MAEIKVLVAGNDLKYTELKLPVKEFRLKRDDGAADMLEITLLGDGPQGFPTFLRLICGKIMLFDGIIDDMTRFYGEKGIACELVARDKFSLLTDNQLRPCTLRAPSLRFFRERYLADYGFTIEGNMSAFQGEMLVKPGTSVFAGIRDFCRNFLGCEPVRRGNVIYCGVDTPAAVHRAKEFVVEKEVSFSRYGVPSMRLVKSSFGTYSAVQMNPEDMGIYRIVYGEGDFKEKRDCRLSLLGLVNAQPGDIYGDEVAVNSVHISYDDEGFATLIKGEVL